MARVWPASKERKAPQELDVNVPLPSAQIQDQLIDLFFTYVHPVFPVIHRTRFLSEYNLRYGHLSHNKQLLTAASRKQKYGSCASKNPIALINPNYSGPSIRPKSPESGGSASPRPEPSQEVTPLLLFSIFTITARFCADAVPPPPKGKMWDAGCDYLDSARAILSQ